MIVGESGRKWRNAGNPAFWLYIRKVERMFLGQFYHNLDDKGRLTVPSRYRDLLLPAGAYIMQGFDQNLIVLPSDNYEELSQRIRQMSITDPNARLLRRLFFSTADRVDIDKAGRILIPQFLRAYAGLDCALVVVGMGDYFEIWSPEAWKVQNEQLQDPQLNADRFTAFNLASG
jgi:MraZ protein